MFIDKQPQIWYNYYTKNGNTDVYTLRNAQRRSKMKKKKLIIILSIALTLAIAIGIFLIFSIQKANKWETAKKATCENPGVMQRVGIFGNVLEEKAIPALGHTYEEETVNATCAKGGYKCYSCSRCDDEYISDFTPAIGHVYGEWTTVEEANCSGNGYKEQICAICNYSNKNILRSSGHSYVVVDTAPVGSEIYTYYECEFCGEAVSLKEGETLEEKVGNDILFDEDITFTFDVKSDENEQFIKDNLKIIDAYFDNSEYEDAESVVQPYVLTDNGNGTWTVAHRDKYDYRTTYLAKLSGGLEFVDYKGDVLTFTTAEDENHVDTYSYESDVLFLKGMENENPGYYPYSLVADEYSDYMYLTVGKIDGFEVGKIVCIGEVASADEIGVDTECCFGKIDTIFQLASGEWLLMLTEPAVSEVFSELDISYNEILDLEAADIDIERVEKEIVDAFMASDDSSEFFASVNLAAADYISDRDLDLTFVSNKKSFLDNIKIEPDLKFEENKLIATLKGEVKIPLTDKNKNEIGKISVGFSINVESVFGLEVKYELKSALGIPYDINYLDVSVVVTDNMNFKFGVDIDIDYSLDEGRYIKNTVTGKIHRRGCKHLNQVADVSILKAISVKEAQKQIKDTPKLECTHCKPSKGFEYEILVINEKEKIIHASNCVHGDQVAAENRTISDKKHTYWMDLGYTCCDWCHPENREQFDFKDRLINSLEYSDWSQTVNEISQYANDAGIKKRATKGIMLTRHEIPIVGVVSVNLQIDFVFSFELDASVTYEYAYTCTNRFGYRLQSDGIAPYTEKTSKVLKDDLILMGKAELRVGFLVDVNLSVVGLSQWARAGFTAEVGLYAELAGILNLSSVSDRNFAAARFEMGLYLDINVYYKLFKWDGDVSIYSKKWALLTSGYDKAYYGYVSPVETLKIDGNYDLSKLLNVDYFDLKSMTHKTEKLKPEGDEDLYTVTYAFKDGLYFRIEGGTLIEASVAPCRISDTLTVKIEGNTSWFGYKKGSAIFYIDEYEITVEAENSIHNEVEIEAVAATCTSDGLSMGKKCSVCDAVMLEQIAVPMTAHTYDDDFDDSCNTCGHIRDVGCIHVNKYATEGIEGSCLNYGLTEGMYCPDCDEVLVSQNAIDPLGHDMYYYDAKAPNCTEVGWDDYEECHRCDYSTYAEIPAVGHVYEDGKCINCVIEIPASEGLSFTSNNDGTCYVSGMGSCTSVDIHIPMFSPDGDKVIGIGSYAFKWEFDLRKVTAYDGLTYIGYGAFYGCPRLVDVILPNTVTTIESSAFQDCSGLKYITMSNRVEEVESSAFSGCSSLTAIAIPDTVKSIGNNAFKNCAKLSEISVPEDIEFIGDEAFLGCTGILDKENGVSYVGKWVVDCDTSVKSATVREDTVGIAYAAFMNCGELERITLPDSINIINDYAFYNCKKLESIKIPLGVTEINEYVFGFCESLKTVELHDDIIAIRNNSFKSCSGLCELSIPDGIEIISADAFIDCTRLVYSLYGNAYYLGNEDNSYIALIKAMNKNITYCNIHEDTKMICSGAFSDCRSLASMDIPDSVVKIDNSAFSGCTNLTNVKLSDDLEFIGDYVFYDCSKLVNVSVPDSVIHLGRSVFSGCSKLASVELSYNIPEIGDYLFYNCTKLVSIVIPDSVETIGNYVFNGCVSLESVELSDRLASVGTNVFAGCSTLKKVTIPGSLKYISDSMFSGCGSLSEVVLHSGVERIGESSFSNCVSLAKINIPESVEYIGCAFNSCTSLQEIYIPSKVRTIKQSTFWNCTGLKKVTFSQSSKLNSIENSAFYGCRSLENISIPPRVKAIGSDAFNRCESLQSVVFLGDNQLTNITMDVFAYCKNLQSINIPKSVTNIHAEAFTGCSKLFKYENGLYYVDKWVIDCDASVSNVVFRDGVAGIAQKAFQNCDNIVSIIIPDSVKGIGNYAFENCNSLVSVTLPSGITVINWNTFANCNSLYSITIPEGVENIEGSAFSGCSVLQSVYIPKSIKSIGYYAFSSCSRLMNVYYGGTKDEWDAIDFDQGNDDIRYNASKTYGYTAP